MNEKHTTAIKIFLFFLVVFSVFVHWTGDPEASRLDLTRAIAENGTLTIDNYHTNTGDKSFINGHYYTDKAPLPSFLGVIPYKLVDHLIDSRFNEKEYTSEFPRSKDPDTALLRLIYNFSLSVIPGALLMSTIFLLIRDATHINRKQSALYTGLFGTGTLIFPYSTTIPGLIIAALLLNISLLVYTDIIDTKRKHLIIGILLGLSVSSSYLAVIPAAAIFVVSNWRDLRSKEFAGAVLMVAGGIIGGIPHIMYNVLIFGHPFNLPIFYNVISENVVGPTFSQNKISMFTYNIGEISSKVIRLVVSPSNGILVFMPILIASIPGFKQLYRDERSLAYIISLSFVGTLMFNGLYSNWIFGNFFGQKYLTLAIALLAVPTALGLEHLRTYFKGLPFILGAVSTLAMLSSTQTWYNPKLTFNEYYDKIYTLQTISNEFINLYLVNIPSKTLNSPVLAYITGAETNLYAVLGPYPEYNFLVGSWNSSIVSFDYRFLIPVITTVLLMLLFRAETKNYRRYMYGVIVTSLILGLSASSLMYVNWYDQFEGEDFQWSKSDPDIYFSSAYGSETRFLLTADIINLNSSQEVKSSLNGETLFEGHIQGTKKVFEALNARPGVNHLSFDTGPCTVIGQAISNRDVRCVGIGVRNLSISRFESKFTVPERKRFTESYSVYLQGNGTHSISFDGRTVGEPVEVSIFVNNRKVETTQVGRFPVNYTTPNINMTGFTEIKLKSSCNGSCPTIILDRVSATEFSKQSSDLAYTMGRNWYNKLPSEQYRWSMGNSSINIYNYRDKPVRKELWIAGRSFGREREYDFYLNGKHLGTENIRTTSYRFENGRRVENKYSFDIRLDPGSNTLELQTADKCLSIGEKNNNDDVRCAAYGLKQLYLLEPQD